MPSDAHFRGHVSAHVSVLSRVPVGWRLAIAGGVAGMLTNLVLFPLDTVKTLRQADPARFPGALPAAFSVLRASGLGGLYAGITPALLGSALSSALYFGTYELVRRRMRGIVEHARVESATKHSFFSSPFRRIPGNALAAASGNIASSILFVPKEVVKQRMQAGVSSGPFVTAALGLIKADGFAGLYRGYKATLLRNIPSTMIRFALYEEAKLLLSRARSMRQARHIGGSSTANPKHGALRRWKRDRGHRSSPEKPFAYRQAPWENVLAGAASGAIASAVTTPMDVVKTKLATGDVRPGVSVLRVAADVIRDQGIAGLYVGIRPRIVWAALFAAVGFSSYEFCKSWLVRQDEWPTLVSAKRSGASVYFKYR